MEKKKKLTNDEKYTIAQDLFMDTDKTQKEIAAIVHVTEKTLTKWKTEGDWDMLKNASTVTARKIIENLYKRSYDLSIDPKSKPDDIIKLALSIEKLSNKRVTISQIINVFKDFIAFAFKDNAQLAKEINLMQKKYVDYKIGEK